MYKVLLKTSDGDKLLHSQIALDATSRLINPTINYKINSVQTFSFTIHESHPLFNAIVPFHSVIEILNTETDLPIYAGRVIVDTPKHNANGNIKECLCEDEFGYLNDSIIRPDKLVGNTSYILTKILEKHNVIIGQKQIFLGKCEFNIQHSFITNYENALHYILQETIEKQGGELYISYANGKRYLNYVKDTGRVNNQPIILGRNLIELAMQTDWTQSTNKFIPLGKELEKDEVKLGETTVKQRVKINYLNPGFTIYKDYLYDQESVNKIGEVVQTKIYDEADTPAKLLELAKADFVTLSKPARTIDLNAMDFTRQGYKDYQSWELGDKVRIVCYDLGIDEYFKIVAIDFPLDSPETTGYTLGTKYGTVTKATYDSAKASQAIMRNINEAGNIRASKLNGTVDMLATQLQASIYDVAQKQEPMAILFENKVQGEPTYGAMALGTLGFMISDEQNPDGSWKWKTFGTGKGFTADLIRAGTLQSKDGTLKIDLGASTFKTYDCEGFPAIELCNTNLNLYDFKRINKLAGSLFTHYFLRYPDKLGISLAHQSEHNLGIAYHNPDKSRYDNYILFDKYKILPNTYAPITVQEDMSLNAVMYWHNAKGEALAKLDNTSQALWMGFMGDGRRMNFGRQWGTDFEHCFSVMDWRQSAGNAGFVAYKNADFNESVRVFGNFSVSGSKNCLHKTQSYGDRLINAYETLDYYFGDLGRGYVGEDGNAFVEIEDMVTQLMNTDIPYHVSFTEIVPKDATNEEIKQRIPLSLVETTPTYFVLKGEPGTEFTWELKAKRRGYEDVRADTPNQEQLTTVVNNFVDFQDFDEVDIEHTILTEDSLEDDLLNIEED